MKKLVLIIAAVFGMAIAANAANYTVNDSAIDALIANAEEVVVLDVNEAAPLAANLPTVSQKEVNPTVALILSWLLGGFGVHRHYMGTKPIMWVLYTITGGGLGVIWAVDTIMILIGLVDGTGIGKYCNNEKFIMWI